jgi:hypothetical protein
VHSNALSRNDKSRNASKKLMCVKSRVIHLAGISAPRLGSMTREDEVRIAKLLFTKTRAGSRITSVAIRIYSHSHLQLVNSYVQ